MPDMGEMADRVSTAREAGMHPQADPWDVTEGEHYTVLAYTDWADMFVPTIVRWEGGQVDDFTDPEATRENKRRAKRTVAEL